jgi:Rho guanine nucleotide exchange factor 12
MSNLFISEFFHTERSHVRKLKVLDRLFYRPLLEEGSHMPRDLVERLFPNLEEVLAWHDKYNRRMKDRIKNEGVPIGNVADILSDMVRCFSGTHLW